MQGPSSVAPTVPSPPNGVPAIRGRAAWLGPRGPPACEPPGAALQPRGGAQGDPAVGAEPRWRAHLDGLGPGAGAAPRARVAGGALRGGPLADLPHGPPPLRHLQRRRRAGRAPATARPVPRPAEPRGAGGHRRRDGRVDAAVWRPAGDGRLGPCPGAAARAAVADRALPGGRLAVRPQRRPPLRLVLGRRGRRRARPA